MVEEKQNRISQNIVTVIIDITYNIHLFQQEKCCNAMEKNDLIFWRIIDTTTTLYQ